MSPEAIKLCIIAAIAAGAGWTINGWRLSGEISSLEGTVATQKQSIATLVGANDRCLAGVQDVKGAVKAYVDAGAARSEAAAAAMKQAAAAAKGHQDAATAALNRVQPAKGKECETIAGEAAKYARKRKAAP